MGDNIGMIIAFLVFYGVPIGSILVYSREKRKRLVKELEKKELAIRVEYHEKAIDLDAKRADLDRKAEDFGTLEDAIAGLDRRRESLELELTSAISQLEETQTAFHKIDRETLDLQRLKKDADAIAAQKERDLQEVESLKDKLIEHRIKETAGQRTMRQVMSKLDLYTRLEEFVDYGHFELPEYLYETSERFAAEIKQIRQTQKAMIKDNTAFSQYGDVVITGDERIDNKIIEGQMKLVMRAFNIEADVLIGKVSPSNFELTLSQFEKISSDLEKLAPTVTLVGVSAAVRL
ncbi:DUF4041 domain-containing protein [Cobetia marina]